MTHPDVNKSCPYSPHSGPVGCLPAPNIFHLANEFAKGKCFGTLPLFTGFQIWHNYEVTKFLSQRNSHHQHSLSPEGMTSD